MTKESSAYRLANHIHETFFGHNDILTEDEIHESGVVSRIGSTSSPDSLRIEVFGEVEGIRAKQTLAMDVGANYHLSTTHQRIGGKHIQHKIYEDAPDESIEILFNTIFMKKLLAIARARNQRSSGD